MAIALCGVPSCGGERIRLGDLVAAESAGGNAGSSGVAQGGASASGGGQVAMGPGGDDGAGGSIETCAHKQVAASEVLWIGDSWAQKPTLQARIQQLAAGSQTIANDEDYFSLAAAAADMAAVAKQYETRQSGATKVKVLLMDGGTWDPIVAQPAGNAAVAKAIENSIATFQSFLAKVASDGTVEHIVYFLVPELPTIPGIATMRPQLQQACAQSAVPCHFIDLQPYWADHPEYTADGIQPSDAGAAVIADLIWTQMQGNCIAQ
jgi:hypothetical protein